jgi:hypothetical protein
VYPEVRVLEKRGNPLKFIKIALPSAVLSFGILLTSLPSQATVAYSKKEKTSCVTCHVGAGKKELNATGTCYKDNDHSLAKCAPKK